MYEVLTSEQTYKKSLETLEKQVGMFNYCEWRVNIDPQLNKEH